MTCRIATSAFAVVLGFSTFVLPASAQLLPFCGEIVTKKPVIEPVIYPNLVFGQPTPDSTARCGRRSSI
jgi:hypothetical protein